MKRSAEVILIVLIIGLAGLLRMGWPGLTEFKLDEARVFRLALDMVELRALPLTATDMSVGLPNSPLTVYLYALPMLAWQNPMALNLFTGALNTAAVLLLYLLTRRYWGVAAALTAALLYATAPWAVLYSRKIWASNLLPLFLTGYVFSGLLAFVEDRRRWVVGHLLLLSVVMQIHISSIALAPVTASLLWWRRKQVDWRWVAVGLAGALLLYAPFLWHLGTRFATLAGLGPAASRVPQVSLDVIELAALVVQGTYTHALAGPSAYQAFNATLPNLNWFFVLGGSLLLAGGGLALYRGWIHRRTNRRDVQAGVVLTAWVLMPAVFFLFHVSPVYPHYLTILFSASFALSGIAVSAIGERLRQSWQRVGLASVPVLVSATQVWQLLALFNFLGTYSTPGAFGVPLERLLNTVDAARRLSAAEVVVVSDGTDPWNDETPAVFDVLLHGTPRRFVDGRTTTVLPEGNSAVVLWPSAQPYPGESLYQQWGGGTWPVVIPLRIGEGTALITVGHGVALAAPRPREASALLSNGAELLGSGGAAGEWELWWRAPDGEPAENYTVFAHLLDGDSERVAQSDLPTYPSANWRAGDLVISSFTLNGSGTSVRAGMYQASSLAPVAVLDVAGNPAGPWVDFPLR